MDWLLHQQIARLAWKQGMVASDSINQILGELSARAESEEISVQIWEERGWLSSEQLERILKTLDAGVEPVIAKDVFGRKETAFLSEASGLGVDSTEIEVGEGLSGETLAESEGFDDTGVFRRDKPTLLQEKLAIAFDETGIYRPESGVKDLFVATEERYEIGEILGQGGGGEVVEAYDRLLGRQVAMKIFRPAGKGRSQLLRFLAEAQATCQLEHPNIMPVYDVGVSEDGSAFYTMLLARHHSLEDVLTGLRNGEEAYLSQYTLNRLVGILKQVSQAIEYAHSRGVIHRDLKPGNIMLGRFGEVLVMDWGLAQLAGSQVRTRLSEESEDVPQGQTLGTPAYMAPEQAKGRLEEIDQRTDVYGLGAILYEMLTLHPPFEKSHPIETMWSVIESALVAPTARDALLWAVPQELEQICLKALARQREDRFQSAQAFGNALEEFSAGLRPQRAAQRFLEAESAVACYEEKSTQATEIAEKIEALREDVQPWEPIERKRRLWKLQDNYRCLELEREQAFAEALACYQRALTDEPENVAARQGLARLYWQRFSEAELRNNRLEIAYFGALVESSDDPSMAQRLRQKAGLRISTRPAAEVLLFPYEELDRRLVVANERQLGSAPITLENVDAGSYLLVLQAKGHSVVRAPVYLRRNETLSVRVALPKIATEPEGFVFIPGGPCVVGGDKLAENPRRMKVVNVASFFCARYPVTLQQYLAFLDDLDVEVARQRAPQLPGGLGLLVQWDEGVWAPTAQLEELLGVTALNLRREQIWQLPVVGISALDAEAYCQWRSELEGRTYRLPREVEWEKAARGVDGRLFPWGDQFDATFCNMALSRKELPALSPVGSFVDDASPYGVRDLSGGVQEWCAADEPGSMFYPARGGSWDHGERHCQLASTRRLAAETRSLGLGMRLICEYPRDEWTDTSKALPPSKH